MNAFPFLRWAELSLRLGILVATALIATSAFAQNRPCIPDCPQTAFGPNRQAVLTLPGGCVVRVTYASRVPACFTPALYDLAIVSIEKLNSPCPTDVAMLVEMSTLALFAANPMGFPMPTSGCLTHYRVTRNVCWRDDSLDCDGDSIAVPCDSSGCCLTSYRICRDSLSQLVITRGTSTVPVGADTCDSAATSCRSVCGASTGFQGGTVDVHDDTPVQANTRLSVRPNPAGDRLIVDAPPAMSGPWQLVVFTVQGDRVLVRHGSFGPTGGIDMDVSSLPTGAYSLMLTTGTSIVNGSFVKR